MVFIVVWFFQTHKDEVPLKKPHPSGTGHLAALQRTIAVSFGLNRRPSHTPHGRTSMDFCLPAYEGTSGTVKFHWVPFSNHAPPSPKQAPPQLFGPPASSRILHVFQDWISSVAIHCRATANCTSCHFSSICLSPLRKNMSSSDRFPLKPTGENTKCINMLNQQGKN